jgi:opacity protein-like surface antigen
LKIKHFVRQSLFFSLFLGGMGITLLASAENLPDIDAHQFKIVPLEKSRTGRVYRFKVDPNQLPKTGSILLIEENNKPTLAFRVVQTDFDHSEFIAKRVRRYDTTSDLKINEAYVTVEKLADLVAPPPAETDVFDPNAKPMLDPNPSKNLVGKSANNGTTTPPPALADNSNLPPIADNSAANPAPVPTTPNKALDVEKYDDSLDSSTSPTDLKSNAMDDGATPGAAAAPPPTPDANDDGYDLEVKERPVLNPYKYMAGFEVAELKNYSNLKITGGSFGGFTAYFSQVIKRNVAFKKVVGPQDSLSIEYGFSYYSDDNVNAGSNDDYDILPLRVELRYDLHLSESFTPFAYFGAQYNLITASSNGVTSTFNSLEGFQPNIGVGVFYNIGPQWYLRGDLGVDRIGIGLAIRW